ncbi:MBL fold metallo-hydrolase [Desulfoscipio geothermicus]|uniref:Glyoxylase, beta-lactamase superfamily II n=1 Tax=Desulfoscipio geothermicus DSM 3669 TaxID=1121426 RepID=A0A1I6CQD7_9FIRM|nr:MBL fold metallo-hydrolase [Desulfoscipio geothermicus]SFQ95392.1 Glyoxylase, beta-lactamase superfamily II [Desulfoscipio geothermicus DSM 3669]
MGCPREVVKDIFLVEFTIPLSVSTVNCYLIVDGNDVLLVDAGILHDDCLDQLEQAMKCLGLELNTLCGVVITHAHVDHYGLASKLREFTGAAIYLHAEEQKLINVQLLNLITEEEGAIWFKENGTSEREIDLIKQDFTDFTQYITNISPDFWLCGGEMLPLSGKKIQIIWTPGHTPGHVCLYIHEKSVLLAGDHILKDTTTHIGNFWWTEGNPLQDYFASLDIIRNLNPKLILPAHGEAFENVAERCDEIKSYRLERNRRLIQYLRSGQKSAWELVNDLWGSALDMGHKRLALADVLAHLKYLYTEGCVSCQRRKNIVYWELS